MSTKRIRVLIVEDSLTVRRRLIEVIGGDAGMEVVGEAVDGQQATKLCHELRPDIVMLDLAMPVMDGLAVTEHIMAHCPTPILIVSGSMERGQVFKTYDALAAGAIEVLEKPRGDEIGDAWERGLLAMVRLVSRIKVITHLRGRLTTRSVRASVAATPTPGSSKRVLAIGTSTGGPAALVSVLKALPTSIPWPILVVIHLSSAFAAPFVHWLAEQVKLPVVFAEDGRPVASAAGSVVVAPADRHLMVQHGRMHLTLDAPVHSCRPAVDVLFASLAQEFRDQVIACLLTGMGKDGALGLAAIRRAGGCTIAEHESTAVVYGMPREAVLLGAAELVLPLPDIGPHLANQARTEVQKA